MKREYPPLPQLKAEFGKHKEIPAIYEEVILKTLSHYPELKDIRIAFRLRKEQAMPYATEPSVISLLSPAGKRHYTVNFLDRAQPPMEGGLFRNLPYEGQMAAVAHELSHIVQFEARGAAGALRLTLVRKDRERERQRQADILVIEHGLGFELYTYASYLRTIRDYLESHPELDVNRLHPNEILDALPPEQLHQVHRF